MVNSMIIGKPFSHSLSDNPHKHINKKGANKVKQNMIITLSHSISSRLLVLRYNYFIIAGVLRRGWYKGFKKRGVGRVGHSRKNWKRSFRKRSNYDGEKSLLFFFSNLGLGPPPPPHLFTLLWIACWN